MIPPYYLYAPHSVRSFELYGYRWDDPDISDSIRWHLYFGLVDRSHEAFLSLCRPGDVVLDVGANTVTLDHFVRDQRLSRVDVVKIDVEGHECSVLEGAGDLLRRDGPSLFIEFDDAALLSYGRSGEELFSLLRGAGYAIFDPSGKRLDLGQSPSGVHFDLICKHTSCAPRA